MLRKLLLLISAVGAIKIQSKQMPYDDEMVYGEMNNMPDMSHMTQNDFFARHEEQHETQVELEREKEASPEDRAEFAREDEDQAVNGFEHYSHKYDDDERSPDDSYLQIVPASED